MSDKTLIQISTKSSLLLTNALIVSNGVALNLTHRSFNCPKCTKVFKRGDHLKRHLLSVHDKDNPYHCGECHKGFVSVESLIKHTSAAHEDMSVKTVSCARCELKFDDVTELDKHASSMHKSQDMEYLKTINKTSQIYTCLRCNKTVSSEKALERHVLKAHGGVDFNRICHECNETFSSEKEQKAHFKEFHFNVEISKRAINGEYNDNEDRTMTNQLFGNCHNQTLKNFRGKQKSNQSKHHNNQHLKWFPRNGGMTVNGNSYNNETLVKANSPLSRHSQGHSLSFGQNTRTNFLPPEIRMQVEKILSSSNNSSVHRNRLPEFCISEENAIAIPRLPISTGDFNPITKIGISNDYQQAKADEPPISEVFSTAMKTLYDGLHETSQYNQAVRLDENISDDSLICNNFEKRTSSDYETSSFTKKRSYMRTLNNNTTLRKRKKFEQSNI